MRVNQISRLLLIATLMSASADALAYTECTGHVGRIYTGDGGYLWVYMDTGVVWNVNSTNPDMKNILANATTGMVTGLPITVRFQADAVPCNSSSGARTDVAGLFLNGS